jgi:hypothetical protein
MGASASVSARDAAPSTTCRICLLSSQDQQPVAAGEGDIHSWPATEVPRLADGAVEDCAQCSRAHFLMEDQIISPCDCSGTQQHVHLHCLLRWIALQPSRGANCEVCNAKFRGLVVDVLADPSMQSFFRIHRTLFACCTTNNRYDRAHSAALSLQMKIDLMSFMRAGGAILQTTSRASTFVELEGMSSEGSAASQLLVLLLASRRKHWNSSAFLIIFSRPRAASDGSTALIAVNITQQQQLRECPAALEFHRTSGVPCTLFRGGPCKSNTPIAVLSVQAAGDWHILFQKAKAVYHPNLVHTWQTSEPCCCFYRSAAVFGWHTKFLQLALTWPAAVSCATLCH